MKTPLRLSVLFFGLLALGFAFSGCSTVPTTSAASGAAKTYWIEALPEWQAPADPSPVTAIQIYAEVAKDSPGAPVFLSDATFTRINRKTADDLVHWTRSFLAITHRGYVPESFDCDKFAKAFTLAVEMCAARAGVKAQPLAARIFVHQRAAFGGVPAVAPPNDGHALVALAVDGTILVVEPQSGETTTLKRYPNRDQVWRVNIGG